MIVKMGDFGSALVTRAAGRQAYEAIVSCTGHLQERTTFDFEGVDSITSSFSDEVFGHLALDFGFDEFKNRTSFRNIRPFWAKIVRETINRRSREAACA